MKRLFRGKLKTLILLVSFISISACATYNHIEQVKPGMSEAGIRARYGEPISRESTPQDFALLYSNVTEGISAMLDVHYYWIIFNLDRKVIALREKISVHYGDSNGPDCGC